MGQTLVYDHFKGTQLQKWHLNQFKKFYKVKIFQLVISRFTEMCVRGGGRMGGGGGGDHSPLFYRGINFDTFYVFFIFLSFYGCNAMLCY